MAQPFNEFADDKRLLWIAEEWQRNADDLAAWAMEQLVNRRDVWGQYTLKAGEVSVVTLPVKERRGIGSDMVTLNKLRRHFKGRSVSHLIGLHTVSDHQTCKWFAIDVDLHDETIANSDEISHINLAACRQWASCLREKHFDPCLIDSNGVGGYHLLVLLDREYDVADVYEKASELRSDFEKFGLVRKPELFPSKPKSENDVLHLGNWLRLPGRHHSRPHYSRVLNLDDGGENEWLEGAEAVEALISLRPSELPILTNKNRKIAPAVRRKVLNGKKPSVCLDLDGVLAKYENWRGSDYIGSPLPGALEFAWSLAKIADIIIFTSRSSNDNNGEEPGRLSPGQLKIRVIDWLEKYKFPFTDVYVGQGKPRAAAFIDDRAVNCRPQVEADAFEKTLDFVKELLNYRAAKSKGPNISDGGHKNMPGGQSITTSSNHNTGNDALTIQISKRKLDKVVKSIQDYYSRERGDNYPDVVIAQAIAHWFENRIDWLTEDIEELLTSPHLKEAQHFAEILATTATADFPKTNDAVAGQNASVSTSETIFNGFRAYSPDKLAAMVTYFVGKGRQIYKTKLNKLLFYADFINFYVHGQSISGSKYVHLPFGPVPDHYESVFKNLTSMRRLQMVSSQGTAKQVNLGANVENFEKDFSPEETQTLEWVLTHYGQMTTREIINLSHREKAYRFTQPSEEIAYGYAQFFEILPKEKTA